MVFRAATTNILSSTSDTKSVGTIPAGVQAGDRVYAFIGSGATAADPLTVPAGWTQVGATFHPSTNLFSAVLYRDVTSSGEAGGTVHFQWSGSASRTWAILQAYEGVDAARAPVSNVAGTSTSSAGPFTAPTVIVPSQDWLITFACGRESPGTDMAKTWAITPSSDFERADVYSSQTGTGQKLTAAGYDSNGILTGGSSGGGTGGSVSLGPQSRPTNTFNALVTSGAPFLVGATVKKEELSYWKPKLAGNQIMRIFPNDADKLPPDWTDSRYTFIRDFGGMPFQSTKCNGSTTKIASLRSWFLSMPSWVLNHPDPNFKLWFTEFHEPEGNMTGSQFINNVYTPVWNMVEALPSNIRARIFMGPVVTRQKTENNPGKLYSDFDPGPAKSDFFGSDHYMNSWKSGDASAVATAYVNPVTFLQRFRDYQYNSSDHRPRIFPELGAIGLPADTTGSARAAWIQGLHDEMLSWTYAAQGWNLAGWIWWCAQGTGGSSLAGAGTHRWFNLDRRHNGGSFEGDSQGGYAILPSVDPPTSGGSSGGGSASARTVSTSVPVNATHAWSVTVPMTAPVVVDPSTVNAWSYLGLPQR